LSHLPQVHPLQVECVTSGDVLQIIENKAFQGILELNPRVQQVITSLYSSKYSEGLALLNSLQREFAVGPWRVVLCCSHFLFAVWTLDPRCLRVQTCFSVGVRLQL
jgi:hypothetical protein